MGEQMTFPESWEEFKKIYAFKDEEWIYTNGAELIPTFRVEQWFEHIVELRYEIEREIVNRINENKGITLYSCDPSKNTECKKNGCYITGGECHLTSHKEYSEE